MPSSPIRCPEDETVRRLYDSFVRTRRRAPVLLRRFGYALIAATLVFLILSLFAPIQLEDYFWLLFPFTAFTIAILSRGARLTTDAAHFVSAVIRVVWGVAMVLLLLFGFVPFLRAHALVTLLFVLSTAGLITAWLIHVFALRLASVALSLYAIYLACFPISCQAQALALYAIALWIEFCLPARLINVACLDETGAQRQDSP